MKNVIKDIDFSQAISANEALHFLKLDFPRRPVEKRPPKKRESSLDKPRPLPRPKPAEPVVSDAKAITRFFVNKLSEDSAKENAETGAQTVEGDDDNDALTQNADAPILDSNGDF